MNSQPTVSTAPARTILRIKRRRTEDPVAFLRLEGVARVPTDINGGESSNDAANLEEHNYQLRQQQYHSSRKRSSAVLWRRFDPEQIDEELEESNGSATLTSQHQYRIINAKFTDDMLDETDSRQTKRRKLTVLDTATAASSNNPDNQSGSNVSNPLHSLLQGNNGTNNASPDKKKKKQPLKILDPLTRMVDDSLQEVLAGSRTAESHFRLLTTDTRFTLQDMQKQRQWWTWCHSSGGGNLLHCCALWNDASTAHQLLQHCQASNNGTSILATLVETTDSDGRTPYEVAQLIGHEQVCHVLEVYGGDTTNYVYDIFYLDPKNMSENPAFHQRQYTGAESASDGDDDDDVPIMTAELTSGVGYWTPEGELILEADEKHARSLSDGTDGEIDSNCEEYGGNDYPDDEEDEDDDAMLTMQHRPQQHLPWRYDDEDDYDEDDECNEVPYQNNDDDHYDVYDWEDDLE